MEKIIWLGVTPLERSSMRTLELAAKVGRCYISFEHTTSGMETYESWAKYLGEWNVIATDQEVIDASWENFFVDNEGKKIFQYKNEEWNELMPGFSLNNPRTR
jgi:hypothetical protein